jgi:uncharacterized protein YecT (DUF1311 family)
MRHFLLCLTTLIGLLPAIAQADDKSKPVRIVTAPSGKFYVEADSGLTLVMANDPSVRNPLPNAGGDEGENNVAESDAPLPIVFISPDEQWIFYLKAVHSNYTSPVPLLYRHKQKLQYELATPEPLDDAAWRFLAQEKKLGEKLVGMPTQDDEVGLRWIDFVDWSSDSRRLLLTLSASIGTEEKGGAGIFKKGIGWWLCYFNTETGKFELTDRLRTANRDAPTRWDGYYAPAEPGAAMPLLAEPIDHETPWTPATRRFEIADKRLNEIFATLLKKLEPAALEQMKQEQREWLIQRDTGAAIHANQRWSPFGKAALMEGKAIATEARTAELERERTHRP